MAWAKLYDEWTDHPKVLAVDPHSKLLWLASISYSNRNLTDGFLPAAQVDRLINWSDLELWDSDGEPTSVDPQQLANRLCDADLWEPVEGGYRVHDFLDYQVSKEQVERTKQAAAERQKASRERRNGASNA